jgi:hypothetical protein
MSTFHLDFFSLSVSSFPQSLYRRASSHKSKKNKQTKNENIWNLRTLTMNFRKLKQVNKWNTLMAKFFFPVCRHCFNKIS